MERRCAKYRKRLQRAAVLQSAKETPRSKTRLLRGVCASAELRRTLLFHHTFVAGVRERYKQMASTRKRKLCAFAVCTKILKKYQMTRMCSQATGIPYRKVRLQAKCYEMPLRQKVRVTSVGERLKQSVSEYFVRDDNSRQTAGKKETVTRNKEKKQKRILLDSMKILHDKYLAENPGSKLSYTLFTQLRPFWVCKPTLRDRKHVYVKVMPICFF